MALTSEDPEFWNRARREGLPWFRFFRMPISIAEMDEHFKGSRLKDDWLELKAAMRPGDQIWPFEFHVRPYLGMRSGYIVLRKNKPVGGIITIVS